MASVNVYSVDGKTVKSVELPAAFSTEYRPDLIHKAVVAEQANKRQPYGPSEKAGMRHAVSQWGKGRGTSRVQRLTQGNKAAESPNNVGGRRAFPPKPEKDYSKKMNKKEKQLAKLSALAAVSNPEIVKNRGHRFDENVTLPLVVENDFEKIATTAEAIAVFESLGVYDDLLRAKDGKKIRAGRGKMRGRKYRTPRSILVVVSENEVPIFKGVHNLPGVEVVCTSGLSAGQLAPGGAAGRLTIFTESALEQTGGW